MKQTKLYSVPKSGFCSFSLTAALFALIFLSACMRPHSPHSNTDSPSSDSYKTAALSMGAANVGIVRYFSPSLADHWIATDKTQLNTSYNFEGPLGYAYSNKISESQVALYSCLVGGRDHMISSHSNCEGTQVLGLLAYVHSAPALGRVAIYRCNTRDNLSHFVSTDTRCEGQGPYVANGISYDNEGLLGYLETSPGQEIGTPQNPNPPPTVPSLPTIPSLPPVTAPEIPSNPTPPSDLTTYAPAIWYNQTNNFKLKYSPEALQKRMSQSNGRYYQINYEVGAGANQAGQHGQFDKLRFFLPPGTKNLAAGNFLYVAPEEAKAVVRLYTPPVTPLSDVTFENTYTLENINYKGVGGSHNEIVLLNLIAGKEVRFWGAGGSANYLLMSSGGEIDQSLARGGWAYGNFKHPGDLTMRITWSLMVDANCYDTWYHNPNTKWDANGNPAEGIEHTCN